MFLQLTEENISTLFVDSSVILLLGGVFLETGIMRKRGRTDDKLFFLLLILNILLAIFDIVTYLADEKSFAGARFLNMAGVTAFYIVFILMFMVWYHYCLVRFVYRGGGNGKTHKAFFIPGIVTEILIIINIFTGWIFSVDSNNIYHRGFLFVPMFLVIGYYLVICVVSVSKYRTQVSKEKLMPVWIYIMPFIVGLAVPYIFGGISVTAPGCAISILFTHIGSSTEIAGYEAKGGETA